MTQNFGCLILCFPCYLRVGVFLWTKKGKHVEVIDTMIKTECSSMKWRIGMTRENGRMIR